MALLGFLLGICLPLPVALLAAGSHPPSIPDLLVRLSADGETTHAIVVEKATQQLFVYAADPGGDLSRVAVMTCSTGKVDGKKQRSGLTIRRALRYN
ncbi:MAG: hypothetical protein EOM10_17705 [Opitutae bacterium]|nr:hypothetical protein [Opitutae bacterium]